MLNIPKEYENYDIKHEAKVHEDEYGHIITIETELTFKKKDVDFISKGQLDYFIPKSDDEYFDFKIHYS